MTDFFKKYSYTPDIEAINRGLSVLAGNLDNIVCEQVLKDCFSMMDLTSLKNNDTPTSIKKLVAKVNAFQKDYPEYPLPASICV